MTAAASVPFSAGASSEYVIEHARVQDAVAKRVVADMVAQGFEDMRNSQDPDRERAWATQVFELTERWSQFGSRFTDEFDEQQRTTFIIEPVDPPARRALKKLGICPLWPFCT